VQLAAADERSKSAQGKLLLLSRAGILNWPSKYLRATVGHEELSQNPIFNRGSRDLHNEFRGGQTELCENR
jgi:hypothetical protein